MEKIIQEKYVQLENVNMTFVTRKGTFEALRGIDLNIREGEFISIIGHSGCGKSTVLNLIAGLLEPTSGLLFCAGREISGPGPDRAVVFQNHSLLPWLTCSENVYLAVERVFGKNEKKAQLLARTKAALELVGLGHAADKRPNEISGGMKQRVGIARAFSIEPKMLLMDEPFGALDALTRGVIQEELLKICAETQQTVFMITHDVDEAILLSDQIMLMSNGPHARIAEIVNNTLPRPRERSAIHKHPHYYPIRNHLVDFLVSRSKQFGAQRAAPDAPSSPAVFDPVDLIEPEPVAVPTPPVGKSHIHLVNA